MSRHIIFPLWVFSVSFIHSFVLSTLVGLAWSGGLEFRSGTLLCTSARTHRDVHLITQFDYIKFMAHLFVWIRAWIQHYNRSFWWIITARMHSEKSTRSQDCVVSHEVLCVCVYYSLHACIHNCCSFVSFFSIHRHRKQPNKIEYMHAMWRIQSSYTMHIYFYHWIEIANTFIQQ